MKEIKITPPEGYEIDRENSTLEHIKFKPIEKKLTYNDVSKELFEKSTIWYTDAFSKVHYVIDGVPSCYNNSNNCTSQKQAEKLLAINKLMNVAKYLNGDWKPDGNNTDKGKWYIEEIVATNRLHIDVTFYYNSNLCYFKSEELAKQAIEILGKETIKLALSTDW